ARGPSLPGAGALGLGAYVESRLGDARPLVATALSALDERAREEGSEAFAGLAGPRAAELLQEVGGSHPGFLESLIFHLYSGYYQHPQVVESIGLEARPPFPGGYGLEKGDLGLLDDVRQRARLYRET
ncbi:MAG: gluconate 2-dehydrogenase subunit 3 family protein, partial [Myxococcota bacterium]|nr:gluconate 2-dehydrogenase subunit 3 family protein [Myxococcota bacterium]